jgi:hypothetical protein
VTSTGAEPDADLGADERDPAGRSPVAELVGRLDGLERRPLADQADVLDAVRRGLDEELARPVSDG